MCDFDVWTYLARLGVRSRTPSDPFFSDGDAVCQMRTCTYLTQEDEEELLHLDYAEFPCSAPGCSAAFSQLIDFETHYNSLHRHACDVCGLTAPSAHLLGLHVAESHDAFFAVVKEKRPSYECWLERCNKTFWTAEERGDHCVGVHQFPADFKFGADCASNSKRSASRNGSSSNSTMDVDGQTVTLRKKKSTKNNVVRRASAASSLPKAISTKTIADDSQLSCLATPRRSSIQRPSAISSGGHRYSSTSPTKLPQLRHQRPHSVYHLSSLPRPVSPSRTGKKLSSATSVTRSGGGDISRRFSLSTMTGNAHNRDAELGRVRATNYDEDSNRRNSTSVPVSPAKRPSLSLARMGERLDFSRMSLVGGSTVDVSMTTNSSPSSSSAASSSNSASVSPSKRASRIPVLNRSLSSKVPQEIAFGLGAQRAFSRDWHAVARGSPRASTVSLLQDGNQFEVEMKLALP